MSDKHACPVPGCEVPTAPGKFMCRKHWFGLPMPLRDEVWRTWRLVQGHRRSSKDAESKLADIRAYRAACKAAISYHDNERAGQ